MLNLPSNVRGASSTSPYAILQTLPGVQADNGLGFSIQGGLPAQSESTIDGISNTYKKQFLPRVGFAYRLNNRTTVRMSGGLYNMILLGSVFYSPEPYRATSVTSTRLALMASPSSPSPHSHAWQRRPRRIHRKLRIPHRQRHRL